MNDSDDTDIDLDTDLKNDPDDPKELSTVADNERPLSRAEAQVAGMLPGEAVYGDDSIEPNADDHRDAEEG
jgi:hypothetical protein